MSSAAVHEGGIRERMPDLLRIRPATRARWRNAGPVLFVAANAIAFLAVRPGVNDLWAAKARADASAHGVGLTYWFSWFGGGSAPGSYSVLTPYLSKLLTAEGVLAISAVATIATASVLLRPSRHPLGATYLAAIAASINVWQGRVPFMLGCAFAVGALLLARKGQWVLCSALALATLAASPVSGAFLGLGLLGVWIARFRTRNAMLLPIGTLLVGALTIVLVFGNPGPEPLGVAMTLGMCALLLALLVARPARSVRITIYLSLVLVVAMAFIPNGMGSNFARFVWFCLPTAVVALSGARRRVLVTLSAAAVAVGSVGLISDLHGAAQPASSASYYEPLRHELDLLAGIRDYRLEVVDDGTHTAAYALLDHATLARGFETQADASLNRDLRSATSLSPATFRAWLDENAVGYVAANRNPPKASAESDLILQSPPTYLHRVWRNRDWVVYRVENPTPIVALPAKLMDIEQARMTVRIPCACTVTVHTRFSPLLRVAHPDGDDTGITVTADPDGWTQITTSAPGRYVLQGR